MPIRTTIVTPSRMEAANGLGKCIDVVSTHHDEGRRDSAIGDRNAGESRRRNGAADAWDHFERDAGVDERRGLFPSTPEHERVAAFQPHDASPALRRADHDGMNVRLRQGVAASALANEKPLRVAGDPEHAIVDERVIQHQIRCAQSGNSRARQKPGVARAGADK